MNVKLRCSHRIMLGIKTLHRPQIILLIYYFVSMMNVYAHVSMYVRVCILL